MEVRVYNDNIHPYSEKFKGEPISIPPKGFISMDYFEAVEFKGSFSPILVDGGGAAMPESYKMIRIVKPEDFTIEESKEIQCHSCGKKFESADLLDSHITASHVELIVDKDEREKRMKAKGA
jgi:hypothetical protein